MKKIFLLFVLIGILSSCSKDDKENIIDQNVTIRNSENYEYDLGFFGDEEGAGIQTQADHFEISELNRDFSIGKVIYTYKPLSEYVGTDYVELITERGSDGSGSNPDRSIIKITFNVTE